MPILFEVLLCLASAGAPLQDQAAQRPTPVRTVETDFNALMFRFGAAVRDYDELRIRKARKQSQEPDPPKPAKRLFPEFLELAKKDSGGAQGWILENLADVSEDRDERLRLAREFFPMLLARHSDEDSILHAMNGLKQVFADFEESELTEMARAVVEKSSVPGTKAEAMLMEAFVHSQGYATTDPARLAETAEMQRGILYTFPKTRAGREVAGILLGPLEKRFFQAERQWVDTLLEMQAQGKPPETWPRHPIHEFAQEYQVFAQANHHTASQFVNKLHAAYEVAERQGIGFGCQWYFTALGDYYGDGRYGPWNALRADLLTAVYRQFPTEKWILPSVRTAAHIAETFPVEHLGPAFRAVLEKNQDPRVQALAYFGLAQTTKMIGDQRSYERAIELFAKVRKEFPDSEVSQSAEEGRADLAQSMPGQPAPNSTSVLDEMAQPVNVAGYRGRVLMLEFWTFNVPACVEALPSRAALLADLADKPFSLLGANLDSIKPREFRAQAEKAGITWRNALVDPGHPFLDGWEVRVYPTTILLDKKGIIQARNLPWEEMVSMAKKLVAEPE